MGASASNPEPEPKPEPSFTVTWRQPEPLNQPLLDGAYEPQVATSTMASNNADNEAKVVANKLKDLNVAGAVSKGNEVNILLLGETGVGKSTFINGLANYLHYKSFKKAKKNDLLVLIPTSFSVAKNMSEQVTVTLGSADKNEYQEVGASATQGVKSYIFPMADNGAKLRLIDSPGMGDTKGIEQDDINCENILSYLSQLTELHAICFIMKPTNTRLTILFEYCMKQILSRLEKSAVKNLVFIFTNTRGTNYTPGDTLPCLRKVVDDINKRLPNVKIPMKPDNIFSIDNEAFRLLAAIKNGIEFDDSIVTANANSWAVSSKECWRMITYILGDASNPPLKPHQLKNTMSINEARRAIVQLSQPLADISQLIEDNLYILDRHEKEMYITNQTLEEMKEKLYIPSVTLDVINLTQPVTVCTTNGCAKLYKVGDLNKWHYKKRCHDPCYLSNVPKEIIGDESLRSCAAMNGTRSCTKCYCDYLKHMHVYYFTEVVDTKIEDIVMKKSIVDKKGAMKKMEETILQIEKRKHELSQEKVLIINTMAQFAHYLQNNAITPFNDSYKEYIRHLIIRERSLGQQCDQNVIINLEALLKQYEESKRAFDEALRLKLPSSEITPKIIMDAVNKLYALDFFGSKIRQLMKSQKTSRKFELDKNTEYIYPKSVQKPKTDVDKKKNKKKAEEAAKSKQETEPKQQRANKNKQNADDQPPPYPGRPNYSHTHNYHQQYLPQNLYQHQNFNQQQQQQPYMPFNQPNPNNPIYNQNPRYQAPAVNHQRGNYRPQQPREGGVNNPQMSNSKLTVELNLPSLMDPINAIMDNSWPQQQYNAFDNQPAPHDYYPGRNPGPANYPPPGNFYHHGPPIGYQGNAQSYVPHHNRGQFHNGPPYNTYNRGGQFVPNQRGYKKSFKPNQNRRGRTFARGVGQNTKKKAEQNKTDKSTENKVEKKKKESDSDSDSTSSSSSSSD